MIQINKDDENIFISEEIPELDRADIVVVGGGMAGAAAALEAANCHKRVVLVERNTFVGSLCDSTIKEWEESELGEVMTGRLRGIRERTPQELLERLLDKGVVLYLHTIAVEVVQDGKRIEGIIVATKRGLRLIRAESVIDATGDDIISAKAGAKGCAMGMTARYTFGIGGADYEKATEWLERKGYPHCFMQKETGTEWEKGELSFALPQWQDDEWKEVIPEGKITISYYGKNRVSQVRGLSWKTNKWKEERESEALVSLNAAAARVVDYLKCTVAGFETSFLDWTSPCVSLRGGFLPKGQKEVCGQVEGYENLVCVKLTGTADEENGISALCSWRNGKIAGRAAVELCDQKRESTLLCKEKLHRKVEIPVLKECDVLIVGGGASGIVSAMAAARKGMKTVLIERNSVLGGDLLAGGLSWLSFYNLYREFDVPEKQVVSGIGYEIVQRLIEIGGSPGFYEDTAPFTQECKGTHGDRECMKRLFFQLVREAGAELILQTLFTDAIVEEENYILGNTIRGVVVQDREKRYAIRAKVVIDASGDGDVAWRAGANCKEYPSHGVGMAFGMTNVNFDKALSYARLKNAVAHEAYGQVGEMEGKLVKYSLRTYFIPELLEKVRSSGIHNSFCIESCHEREASYINGVTTPQSNILDPREATDTIIDLRRRLFRASDFLKENIPGFEDAEINWCTQIPGARQSRCIDCYCSITGDDVENGVIPEDSIGLFGGHDGHYAGYKIKNGGWYGIPYRAMLPHFIRNVFVVGRMLSADWVAYMSTRLNVSCFIQGQAAGTAAAMAIREGCSIDRVNVKQLQKELRQDGVYLE